MKRWIVVCLILFFGLKLPVFAQDYWEAGVGAGFTAKNFRTIDLFVAGETHGFMASMKTNTFIDFSGDAGRYRFTGYYAGYLNKFHPKAGMFVKVGAGERFAHDRIEVDGSFGALYRLNYMTVSTELSLQRDFTFSMLFTLFKKKHKIRAPKNNYTYSNRTIDIDRRYD